MKQEANQFNRTTTRTRGRNPRRGVQQKLATSTNQAMMSGDKVEASTEELQQSKTRSSEERKGKLCESEGLPCVPIATLSLHGDRHRSPGSCEGEAPPRAPSATLSLHDHWWTKTEASAAQLALPATRAPPHPKNADLVRK
jgi:hypothetical protein